MADATPTPPTDKQMAEAMATLARAAAAKPFPQAMAERVVSPNFVAALADLRADAASYANSSGELGYPDLHYAVMSMERLISRYAPTT